MSGFIFLLVVGASIVYIVSIYNRLVSLKNRYENAFAQIDVQLKRRYDLIPNLVDTAKAYLKHEKETLESVINARNEAMNDLSAASKDPSDAHAIKRLQGAENALGNALARFNVVMEAYPDLKANENMAQLSEELKSTENKVAFARQSFNDSVTEYNTYKQTFPPVFFAGFFGHVKDATLLQFDDRKHIQAAPKVNF